MRLLTISAALLLLAGCAATDAQGNLILTERSDALGNLHAYMSSGTSGSPTPVYKGPCNPQDITGCTGQGALDRDEIIAAWRAGKLLVESPDGIRTKVPPSAKFDN
jgi:hypothetical protein